MTKRRELTDFGIGALILGAIAYFLAGLLITVSLKVPNANHDGHHHFVASTWIAFAAWLGPFLLAAIIAAAAYWWHADCPGLWRTNIEPVTDDLRTHRPS